MEITANAIQTIEPNANVLFTNTTVCGGCSIIHMDGSGLVTLRGLARCQSRARFKVYFSGNAAVPAGETVGAISLAIALNGEPVPATTMMIVPAAVNEYWNLSSATYIDVPAGVAMTISVKNITSELPIEVQNANLIVERVA